MSRPSSFPPDLADPADVRKATGGMSALHPRNTVGPECRHPGLPCDILCLECRGDFDVIDRKTGRRAHDVDDATAMARLLAEFDDVDVAE